MSKPLRIAYFGSPEISRLVLEQLLQNPLVDVVSVFTQPDKRVGRRQTVTPCPVKRYAQELEIETAHEIDEPCIKMCDLAVVYAYGHIIPANIITLPANGFWNIHPSLLPAYRGPSPVAYPFLYADRVTGCTIIQMDEQMDHGDILMQKEWVIPHTATRKTAELALTQMGYSLLASCIETLYKKGREGIQSRPQIHSTATYTKKLIKEDGYIPFEALKQAIIGEGSLDNFAGSPIQRLTPPPTTPPSSLTEIIIRLWKAMYGWPGLWTTVSMDSIQKRLKLLEFDPTSHDALKIKTVQLEGKKPVDWSTFIRAYPETMS